MTVTIDKTGVLVIQAENELEAYALTKWGEENEDRERPRMVVVCDKEE